MSSFERYYRDLLAWEEVLFTPLISLWADADVQTIADDFTQAIARSAVRDAKVPIRAGSTNQSVGNQVEEFFRWAPQRIVAAVAYSALFGPRLP